MSSSRLPYLLGEMRRQMNGAVVGSMRFYGAEYGLNYGVCLPTIRQIARAEVAERGADHRFARLLYQQEVRELRLAALWFADCDEVRKELDFWAVGVINSEIAEEAAFALLHRVDGVERWAESDSELLCYCALLSIAKRGTAEEYLYIISELLTRHTHLVPKAAVTLLESALRCGVARERVLHIVETLPAHHYVRDEMAWRMEL